MRIFLSFNSKDAALAQAVREGICRLEPAADVFFSPASLQSGLWVRHLSAQIAASDAFLLLIGPNGTGPWQAVEYYDALDRHVTKKKLVLVPVIAAGAEAPGLDFLRTLTWVELPVATEDVGLHRVIAALKGAPPERATPLWQLVNPYCGLEAMTEANADYFYGRDAETEALLQALADHPSRLPVLIGASGVGKSSVAQAGVLSALKAMRWPGKDAADRQSWPAGLENSRNWVSLSLRPGDAPLEALAGAFIGLWGLDATNPARAALPRDWAAGLLAKRNKLVDLISITQEKLQERQGEAPDRILLYLNQAEELYTRALQSKDAAAARDEARRFSEALIEGLADARLLAFASLRADHFDKLQDDPLFKHYEHVDVPPLDRDRLYAVVTAPARELGVKFDDDRIADSITDAAAAEPGALPLLSYLLTDMWKQMKDRGNPVMGLPSKAIDIGGVLADRADRFLSEDPGLRDLKENPALIREPGEARALWRLLTLKLAIVPPEGQPLRRQTYREECTDEEWSLANRLAEQKYRLVVMSERQRDRRIVAEVAHEAFLRAWPVLALWLREERDFLVLKADVERAERRWREEMGKADTALLAGLDLTRAGELLPQRSDDLSPEVRAFVERSIAADRSRKQKQLRFQRRVAYGAAGAAVVLATVAAFAVGFYFYASAALNTTTRFSEMMVFDLGQDPAFAKLPQDLRNRILNRAIDNFNEVIKLAPKAAYAYDARAGAYLAKGDVDRALADYDRAIALDPEYAYSYNGRGFAYSVKGDADHAIADYSRSIMLDPSAAAFFGRGKAYGDKRDFDRAIADYDQAITLDPKPFALVARGGAYRGKGDIERAIADDSQAIMLDPKYAPAYGERGNAYRDKHDLDRAIADYSQAITLDPQPFFLYARGQVYHSQGKFDQAIADYTQAIMLDPRPVTYNARGIAYGAKGDFHNAIADYSRAIMLDPRFAAAYYARGSAYSTTRDLDRAIADYSQAIMLDPQGFSYYARASAYADQQKFAQAIADYTQAIMLDPRPVTFYARGIAYAASGDTDRAIADFTQAIMLDPQAATFYARGEAYNAKDMFDPAIADYSQAITLDPSNAAAYFGRADALLGKGDFDKAAADFTHAIMLDPQNPDFYDGRCWARMGVGKELQAALSDCNESLRIRPNDAWTLADRGLAYLKLGRADDAIGDFNAALAGDPQLARALYGRGLAKLAKGDRSGAETDMRMATALQADVAQSLARAGIR